MNERHRWHRREIPHLRLGRALRGTRDHQQAINAFGGQCRRVTGEPNETARAELLAALGKHVQFLDRVAEDLTAMGLLEREDGG